VLIVTVRLAQGQRSDEK